MVKMPKGESITGKRSGGKSGSKTPTKKSDSSDKKPTPAQLMRSRQLRRRRDEGY